MSLAGGSALRTAKRLQFKSKCSSDASVPFPDGLVAAAEADATAAVLSGGSKRDGEVIAAAGEWTVAMVFTGVRHFRHQPDFSCFRRKTLIFALRESRSSLFYGVPLPRVA